MACSLSFTRDNVCLGQIARDNEWPLGWGHTATPLRGSPHPFRSLNRLLRYLEYQPLAGHCAGLRLYICPPGFFAGCHARFQIMPQNRNYHLVAAGAALNPRVGRDTGRRVSTEQTGQEY